MANQHVRRSRGKDAGELELITTSRNVIAERTRTAHGKKRSRSLVSSLGIKSQTIQAAGILILAIGTSVVWNRWSIENDFGPLSIFLKLICGDASTFCHLAMAARRRTLAAVRGMIHKHETILEIPRHLTIWDLDALRDPWIQQELFAARILGTTPLPSAAFLAAYLARRLFPAPSPDAGVITNTAQQDNWNGNHPILQEYLSILPNTVDDFAFHPILWPDQELEVLLGTYTSTYDHVIGLRRTVNDEYTAFAKASTDFASQISYEQYQVARLNVLTRSFGTGKLQSSDVPEDEIVYYRTTAGVDLSNGCHAMVPILDMYNHHAKPNVDFSYHSNKHAFVVTAVRVIPAGAEIFDSYGKRTDSDLFAKYGFVNGDGSEYTQASLALWHHVDPDSYASRSNDLLQLNKQLLRYLQYDDGYESCVLQLDADAAWELKRLKYRHLRMVAILPQRWVVRMPPRDMMSRPGTSSQRPITLQPPAFDMRHLQFDGSILFSTCRLIVLTHGDYNGTAVELLQANLQNSSFVLPPTRDALEFRTLMCIARMAQTALGRFGVTMQAQLDQVSALNRAAFQSSNWTIAHLRLGEIQTLEALKQTAFAGLRSFQDRIDSEPAFSMRDNPCPLQALQSLLDEG
jgi:SET domain